MYEHDAGWISATFVSSRVTPYLLSWPFAAQFQPPRPQLHHSFGREGGEEVATSAVARAMAATCGAALSGARLDSKLASSLLPRAAGLSSSCGITSNAFKVEMRGVASMPQRKSLQVVAMASRKPDIVEEDAGTASSLSPLEELLNKAGRDKYLLALAGVPGIFAGLEGSGSVVQSVAVLAAVISVHETGHFLAARLQGIHVTKFAIGFGPTLAKWQGKEVEYSLRAIPLGGYVAFPDDDPNSGFKSDDPDLLKNRGIPARALVISAGVLANIVFAYSVLVGQVLTVGLVEQEYLPGVIIPEIIARSAASRGGLEAGDIVLSVDGHSLGSNVASVFDLVDVIKDNPGRALDFEVRRQELPDLLHVNITPDVAYDGAGKIGVQLSTNARLHRVKANNLGEAVTKASKEFGRLTSQVTEGLKQVVFNFAQTADKLSGPVAIVAVGAEVARSDIAGLFQFAAIVNINLAIVNMLPLPALDGGYLFLIMLEALRGKKLPEGVEKGIMSSGILLLLALGVVLMVRDTLNLGIVQQLL
jgi:membrane-associated protease RseP (regulator of RpoE activity)